MPTVMQIQERLNREPTTKPKLGVDGDPGRLTQQAIAAFQKAKGVDVKYPGTIGPKTLKALGFPANDNTVTIEQKQPGKGGGTVTVPGPVYLIEARRKLGLHEKKNHATLAAYLKSDGRSVGDPALNPWCGDFVETTIAKTLPHEPLPGNPYYALNWSKWGQPLAFPALGAIITFRRYNNRGKLIGGHIGYLVGHDKTHYHVLGGNQSDGVTISKIAKGRMDAIRWPSTLPLPTVALPMTSFTGTISTNEA